MLVISPIPRALVLYDKNGNVLITSVDEFDARFTNLLHYHQVAHTYCAEEFSGLIDKDEENDLVSRSENFILLNYSLFPSATKLPASHHPSRAALRNLHIQRQKLRLTRAQQRRFRHVRHQTERRRLLGSV